jgi:LacI family repressor for deo operon, udp, cdd, tsx, nupC, and nupG
VTTPTIRKVAELAGVSIATVSRALSQPDKVSARTRDKVLAAVAATGFVPNRQAIDFRRKATRNVVLLVRDISNPFYLDLYRGVEERAFVSGYRVLMGDAGDDDARILRYVDMVRNRQADGLILMTGHLPAALLAGRLPPMVVALELIEGVEMPSVFIDNAAAAHMAVSHLVSLGHRRIAHITGPAGLSIAEARTRGYREALADSGLDADPGLLIPGDFHFSAGQAAVRRLLGAGADFTAIFASNDEMAVGAINELRAHGLFVPRDVSVVGFDDIVFAEASDPPLTSVRQPRREVGATAMDMMIAVLSGDSAPRHVQLGFELIIRGSTSVPALTQTKKVNAR